jgi:osmotically-inducible protein OsmY
MESRGNMPATSPLLRVIAMNKWLYVVCILAAFHSACALKGGKYDRRIAAATSVILQDNNYKNVHAEIEDGVVTLSGTVKLESLRAGLEYKVRHLWNVAQVRNEILLDPPPMADKVLVGQLSRKLREAGFETVQIKAHNGAVTLLGTVRTQRERDRIIQTVWSTDGVREVSLQISLAY